MGVLAWVMMALAIWHFTIFLPDRFWAGIVGAFVGAVIGAVVVALAINGGDVPGNDETNIGTVLQAIPGTLIGLAAVWAIGVRGDRLEDDAPPAVGARDARERPASS